MIGRASRRKIIKAAVGSAFAADVVWSSKILDQRYSVSPEIASIINEHADILQGHISHTPFPDVIRDGELLKGKPNEKAFASVLLHLSYLDGGVGEMEQVNKFFQENGLHIQIEDTLLGEMTYSASWLKERSDNRPILSINPDNYIAYDESKDWMFWHELYHAIQEGRNPEADKIRGIAAIAIYLGGAPVGGGIVAGRVMKSSLETSTQKTMWAIDRRKFLRRGVIGGAGIVGASAGFIGTRIVGAYLEPSELQAHMQIGNEWYSIPSLLNTESLQQHQGSFIVFEQKRHKNNNLLFFIPGCGIISD